MKKRISNPTASPVKALYKGRHRLYPEPIMETETNRWVYNRETLGGFESRPRWAPVVSMCSAHLSQLLPPQQASGLGSPLNGMTKCPNKIYNKIITKRSPRTHFASSANFTMNSKAFCAAFEVLLVLSDLDFLALRMTSCLIRKTSVSRSCLE